MVVNTSALTLKERQKTNKKSNKEKKEKFKDTAYFFLSLSAIIHTTGIHKYKYACVDDYKFFFGELLWIHIDRHVRLCIAYGINKFSWLPNKSVSQSLRGCVRESTQIYGENLINISKHSAVVLKYQPKSEKNTNKIKKNFAEINFQH